MRQDRNPYLRNSCLISWSSSRQIFVPRISCGLHFLLEFCLSFRQKCLFLPPDVVFFVWHSRRCASGVPSERQTSCVLSLFFGRDKKKVYQRQVLCEKSVFRESFSFVFWFWQFLFIPDRVKGSSSCVSSYFLRRWSQLPLFLFLSRALRSVPSSDRVWWSSTVPSVPSSPQLQ